MKVCDICGSVLRKTPYNLSLRPVLERNEYNDAVLPFFGVEPGDEWKMMSNREEIKKKMIDIEICHNCANVVPKILKKVRKEILSYNPLEEK